SQFPCLTPLSSFALLPLPLPPASTPFPYTTLFRSSVTKAYPVVINDGGEKIKVWTTGDSIESLLDENDIELSNKDKVKPALNKRADENTSITVTRVEKETDTVEETVAYETEKRNDDSLPKGEEKVISDGKEGKLVKEYEITLENGKEVDRKLVTEE